ncbi:hypothetical protein AGR4C_pa50030 [Agrobacterium tumefaciens str. Kerr 14]|uniref:Uncharacterized protein n=1 Tax=Agrobacterium tumefaciens str. Kerr 14 TaxID=1183424 RepID=A0A1S7SB25_AGRTU|nr:hypothetical protein AGR4C_pa50030 [Agrobacterium tumefaciens str. Kerr 14]
MPGDYVSWRLLFWASLNGRRLLRAVTAAKALDFAKATRVNPLEPRAKPCWGKAFWWHSMEAVHHTTLLN